MIQLVVTRDSRHLHSIPSPSIDRAQRSYADLLGRYRLEYFERTPAVLVFARRMLAARFLLVQMLGPNPNQNHSALYVCTRGWETRRAAEHQKAMLG